MKVEQIVQVAFFEDLKPGEAFKDKDGCIMLKIETWEDCGANAVDLENGTVDWYPATYTTELVEATVEWESKKAKF